MIKMFKTKPRIFFILIILFASLILTSCNGKIPEGYNINNLIGFIKINPRQDSNIIEYTVSKSYTQATANLYCELGDRLFNNGYCQGKDWDECDSFDFQWDDTVNFENIDFNSRVKLHCSQNGLFDGCGWLKPRGFDAVIRLCDNEKDCTPTSSYNEILIDLRKAGLSKKCTKIAAYTEGGSCEPSDKLLLYTDNNFEHCDDYDDSKVCVNGKCTKYVCIPDGKLQPYEPCDPESQTFNISGKIVEKVRCQDFGLYPKETEAKPKCNENCMADLSDCDLYIRVLCGDGYIQKMSSSYNENCDQGTNEEYIHPDGTPHTKSFVFDTKRYCAQNDSFIGDASGLDCENCLGINFDNCEPVQTAPKTEQNCDDNFNDDYWYDLYVPEGNDRTEYIVNNYLDENGYFSNFKFDTSQCYNETTCYDCYDKDCDGKTHYGYTCNFKQERFCNDGFDNDGDGLIDSKDPDCSYEKYNPDLSQKGYCLSPQSCFDESVKYSGCINNAGTLEKDESWYICNNGEWENEVKVLVNLILNKFPNSNNLIIYCNDAADKDLEQGYVLNLNSKASNGEPLPEFLNKVQGVFGKFCAAKSGDNYLIGTVIKSKKNFDFASQIFTYYGACSQLRGYENELEPCGSTSTLANNRTKLIVKTNKITSPTEFLTSNDKLRTYLTELRDAAKSHLGLYNKDLDKIIESGQIDAFALKKNGNKQLLGALVTVNSTMYGIIELKGVESFTEICKSMNENANLKIGKNLIRCYPKDKDKFVFPWQTPESYIDESKKIFDQLIKGIKI
ncbi:MAG: hypothetical protein PWP03_685 [Candidatus Woesearchaeota archaeon]|nr:hypothetical protein [Candidatus Woesearchaeota archaeon]